MTPEAFELARHRLLRARETLAEAETLLRTESFNGAVNRFYCRVPRGANPSG